ncbi:hypothetical protein, partial [Pseudomonas putida]|uniref:hypothetical protein n=1 Tax=Pseudomonas putida TaxID=303 RepID=UPI001CF651F2
HFHTDHPVFSCSKIEQKQLNTWVSFQSAEQPLLGQFSVSGNRGMFSSVSKRLPPDVSFDPWTHMKGVRIWKSSEELRNGTIYG